MKQEDKYLDDLFEQAKNEPPQLSFEEVATRFESSVATTGSLTVLKEWIFNHLNLNSFLMITIASAVLAVLHLIIIPTNPSIEIENSTTEIKPIEVTRNDNKESTNKTIVQKEITLVEEKAKKIRIEDQVIPIEKLDKLAIDISYREPLFIIPELAKKNELDTSIKEITKPPSINRQNELQSANKIRQDTILPGVDQNNPSQTPNNRDYSGWGFTIDTDEKKWQKESKSFHKEFDVGPNGITKIINEFGKIDISKYLKEMIKAYSGNSTYLPIQYAKLMLPGDEDIDRAFWGMRERNHTIGHEGSDPGVQTDLRFSIDSKIGRIILCNVNAEDNEIQWEQFRGIQEILAKYENKLSEIQIKPAANEIGSK